MLHVAVCSFLWKSHPRGHSALPRNLLGPPGDGHTGLLQEISDTCFKHLITQLLLLLFIIILPSLFISCCIFFYFGLLYT